MKKYIAQVRWNESSLNPLQFVVELKINDKFTVAIANGTFDTENLKMMRNSLKIIKYFNLLDSNGDEYEMIIKDNEKLKQIGGIKEEKAENWVRNNLKFDINFMVNGYLIG